MIPFNKPYLHGRELVYIAQAVASGKISGDGTFTRKCHDFFEKRYGFAKCLMTTSCTDALEMTAILLNLKPGDEIIVPAFTFVSSANAYALRGASLVFADSQADSPNVSIETIEPLVTSKTKAIVVVHYAGIACDMDPILSFAKQRNIAVIEDAAQSVDSFYKGRPLGGLGQMSAFSFHETKNVISGEGGMLVVNDPQYNLRAEIIREKGTNRTAFFRGEVDKYGWVDIGSSFLPSDIISAYLYAQLENIDSIQSRRKDLWQKYFLNLANPLREAGYEIPEIPAYATNNAHMFYIVCPSLEERSNLIAYLKNKGIHAVFHYLSLHSSPYFKQNNELKPLKNSDKYSDRLLRLPLFFELTDEQLSLISDAVLSFVRG